LRWYLDSIVLGISTILLVFEKKNRTVYQNLHQLCTVQRSATLGEKKIWSKETEEAVHNIKFAPAKNFNN